MNADVSTVTEFPKTEIRKACEMLCMDGLTIPEYQRPYKWTTPHVEQLLSDILVHSKKSAYRLGTAVLHEGHQDGGLALNIVDGQQRAVTLLLIIEAAHRHRLDSIGDKTLRKQLDDVHQRSFQPTFTSPISKRNAWLNYRTIERAVTRSEFTEQHIDFLLNRCEFVCVTLNDVSEAFQFFDAHNARGRDLAPHDLLKAFHLREFSDAELPSQRKAVRDWEQCSSAELVTLFADYLYRIRRWVRGMPARYFSKDDVTLFKGVSLHRSKRYPLVQPLRIAHAMVDDYNRHATRDVDGRKMDYPFQLDQPIVNGRRFFGLVDHYRAMGLHHDAGSHERWWVQFELGDQAKKILGVLDRYEGRYRTGDGYVRNLFDCLLLYYMDRFGEAELSRAVEKSFIWAYTLRLTKHAVQRAGMDNHALAEPNLFAALRDATDPEQFLQIGLPLVGRNGNGASGLKEIEDLFVEMKYLEQAHA